MYYWHLHFFLNSSTYPFRTRLTPSSRSSLRRWLYLEYEMYRHFRGALQEKIRAFGRKRMEREKVSILT